MNTLMYGGIAVGFGLAALLTHLVNTRTRYDSALVGSIVLVGGGAIGYGIALDVGAQGLGEPVLAILGAVCSLSLACVIVAGMDSGRDPMPSWNGWAVGLTLLSFISSILSIFATVASLTGSR